MPKPNSKHRKKPAAATVPATPNTPPPRKILFALTAYSGELHVNTMTSIAQASVEAAAQGWQTDMMVRTLDSIISRARNVLASTFHASDATDLLFIDCDVAWDPGVFTRLMSHDVDLVGGVYPSRGDSTVPGMQDFVVKTLPGEFILQPNGLAEVDGVGTGFMRITRNCMNRMVEVHRDRWFYDKTAPNGMKIYSLFDFQLDIVGRQMFSEDYVFCRRWRETGGKVWADCELVMHHTGEKTFTGHCGAYLRAKTKAENLMRFPATLGPARIAEMTKQAIADTGVKL